MGAPRRLELIGGLGVFSKAGCAPEVGIDRRFWGFFSKYEVKYCFRSIPLPFLK